jgi:hypothetical protein
MQERTSWARAPSMRSLRSGPMSEATGHDDVASLAPDDAKLVTLARAARARTGAAQGAAVRDDIGRTYAAASVELRSLRLSALQAAVAAALSSGSQVLEAAVVLGALPELEVSDQDLLSEVSVSRVLLAAPDGTVRDAAHQP